MEFLVEFEVNIPIGTAESEIHDRQTAEAASAADLVRGATLCDSGMSRSRTATTKLWACTGPVAQRRWKACSPHYPSTNGCKLRSRPWRYILTIRRRRLCISGAWQDIKSAGKKADRQTENRTERILR